MLAEWLAAVEDWPVAEALRASFYVYPFVNAAHVFGIGLLIGSILPVDLRLLGAFRQIPLAGFVPVMTGFSAAGLIIAVTSGFLLFSVKPLEYADNPAFLTKIALVAVGAANGLGLRWTGAWRSARAGGGISPGLRASALLSLVIWPAALLSGRWIGYL
ncbi:MAG TPA: DUF2214 domain-containing protein [Afifellaceae bacterium]|nr:DUF2214 domain-containing protein [Afifellaceae bacterium]